MYPLKKVLLISEAPLSKNGGGISQTLHNLFDGYPSDRFLALCAEEDVASWGDKQEGTFQTVTFRKRLIRGLNNRLGSLLNPTLGYLNLSLLYLFLPIPKKVREFKPELIVICANGSEGLILAKKAIAKFTVPFIVYFMDDWFHVQKEKWIGGNLQAYVKGLLHHSSGWIMISKYLQQELASRYAIPDKECLIAHNPVVLWHHEVMIQAVQEKGIRIAYAGSLWPMHLDAFKLVAAACAHLRSKGIMATLHMFGNDLFFQNNRSLFDKENVAYGGKISYSDLYKTLYPFDFLLVCSSFEKENAPFSKSSVQTKITDYLNVGKPILSVGPSYSACNLYIEENQIGYTFKEQDTLNLAKFLEEMAENSFQSQEFVKKGKELIAAYYNKQTVQKTLYDFLQSCGEK